MARHSQTFFFIFKTRTGTDRQGRMPQAANRYTEKRGSRLDIPDGIATTIHALYHCVSRFHGPMATLMQCRLEYLPSLHIGPPGPICRVLLRPTKLLLFLQHILDLHVQCMKRPNMVSWVIQKFLVYFSQVISFSSWFHEISQKCSME